jgi:hypothetical protein
VYGGVICEDAHEFDFAVVGRRCISNNARIFLTPPSQQQVHGQFADARAP